MDDDRRLIADAYRWQRRLGHRTIETRYCGIVADLARPDLWDANHADNVTAEDDAAIDAVLAALDENLGHSDWRVVHSDCFTPERFLARLAYLGFEERPVVVQMACDRLKPTGGADIDIVEVREQADWDALANLVLADVEEGNRTGHLDLDAGFVLDMPFRTMNISPARSFSLWIVAPRRIGRSRSSSRSSAACSAGVRVTRSLNLSAKQLPDTSTQTPPDLGGVQSSVRGPVH